MWQDDLRTLLTPGVDTLAAAISDWAAKYGHFGIPDNQRLTFATPIGEVILTLPTLPPRAAPKSHPEHTTLETFDAMNERINAQLRKLADEFGIAGSTHEIAQELSNRGYGITTKAAVAGSPHSFDWTVGRIHHPMSEGAPTVADITGGNGDA